MRVTRQQRSVLTKQRKCCLIACSDAGEQRLEIAESHSASDDADALSVRCVKAMAIGDNPRTIDAVLEWPADERRHGRVITEGPHEVPVSDIGRWHRPELRGVQQPASPIDKHQSI